MNNSSVVIATNASFLADALREILRDAFFKVYIAANDDEFAAKLKTVYPRFIFVENCFHGLGTDVFIQRIIKHNHHIHIVVWTAADVKPFIAARFIVAGAESFFSLRDTYKNIEKIIFGIAGGNSYYPDEVEAALDKDSIYPIVGKKLTKRETEITQMVLLGFSNKQISEKLSLNLNTVKFHRKNIYRKLGCNKAIDIMRTVKSEE